MINEKSAEFYQEFDAIDISTILKDVFTAHPMSSNLESKLRLVKTKF